MMAPGERPAPAAEHPATFAGRLVAVVPVRSFSGGKTRLAEVLSPDQRADLIRAMLALVVRAIADSGTVAAVVVVSSDEEVLRFAASLDPLAYPLSQDLARPGLNSALEDARAWAVRHGAAGLLVVSGDLPLLSPGDVRALVRRDAPIVIAPDRHGLGTNALLLRLGSSEPASNEPELEQPREHAFQFQFGPVSCAKHRAEAARLGVDAAIAMMPGTALDLDTPADLREIEQRSAAPIAAD